MTYELRICRCVPGRKPALLSRFENEALRIWEKHDIRQAVFWTTLIGKSEREITYMLAWNSMAERETRWGAFLTDPEWSAVVARTEKDGQLVEDIGSQLLAPAAFSVVESDFEESAGLMNSRAGAQIPPTATRVGDHRSSPDTEMVVSKRRAS